LPSYTYGMAIYFSGKAFAEGKQIPLDERT